LASLHPNHSKHLNSNEVTILKPWAWQGAHRDKDGPAHRLFREGGIDLGQPVALLHAADLAFPNEEALGARIVPGEWPWGEQSLSEIREGLSTRSSMVLANETKTWGRKPALTHGPGMRK
jgi:hypothetical protein